MQDSIAIEQTRIAQKYQADTEKRRGERDGVVVTPVEIVDFQVRAVIDQLAKQGLSLASPVVRVTDPFGGTGIYAARLMQLCGLTAGGLDHLYHHRLWVNEIDQGAANIADENLRSVFQQLTGRPARKSVVTCLDTFTLKEGYWPWGDDINPA